MNEKINIGMTARSQSWQSLGTTLMSILSPKLVDLPKEYTALFPWSFTEMKGVVGELGEMN